MDLLVGVSKENPGAMTDKDIREEVDTFLFEGHDTSSIAMTMAIIHLGLDQNMQVSKTVTKKILSMQVSKTVTKKYYRCQYKTLNISKTTLIAND